MATCADFWVLASKFIGHVRKQKGLWPICTNAQTGCNNLMLAYIRAYCLVIITIINHHYVGVIKSMLLFCNLDDLCYISFSLLRIGIFKVNVKSINSFGVSDRNTVLRIRHFLLQFRKFKSGQ